MRILEPGTDATTILGLRAIVRFLKRRLSSTSQLPKAWHRFSIPLRVTETEDGGMDRADRDRLATTIKDARQQPHTLTAYSRGRAYKLHIRKLVE